MSSTVSFNKNFQRFSSKPIDIKKLEIDFSKFKNNYNYNNDFNNYMISTSPKLSSSPMLSLENYFPSKKYSIKKYISIWYSYHG